MLLQSIGPVFEGKNRLGNSQGNPFSNPHNCDVAVALVRTLTEPVWNSRLL